MPLLITVKADAPASEVCGGEGDASRDWLVAGCDVPSTLASSTLPDGSTRYTLQNGVISRELVLNASTGLLSTTAIRMPSLGAGTSPGGMTNETNFLSALVPETVFVANGERVAVGGEPTTKGKQAEFAGFRSNQPVRAGGFHFVAGARGSDPGASWPPKGTRVEFDHTLPCSAIGAGAADSAAAINVTIVYELYAGTSAFGKRVLLSHSCTAPLFVFNMSVSFLSVEHDRSIVFLTDASVAQGGGVDYWGSGGRVAASTFLQIDHGQGAPPTKSAPHPSWSGPGLSWFTAGETFESYLVAEIVHGVPFSSSEVGHGKRRYGLETARFWQLVAPHTTQLPINVHAVCVGGSSVPPEDGQPGSAGYWCYDKEGTRGIEAMIDQCKEAGAEMLGMAQNMNYTWRSFIGNEFVSQANVSWFRQLVERAHNATVYPALEMGAYQLLLNARSASARDQCAPSDAATLPMSGYDTMDPTLLLPCHNNARADCRGGSACCAMCGATEFYDEMKSSMLDWWRAVGATLVDQDGAESATPCANASHANHHGLNDSLWVQYQSVRSTFHDYLSAPASYEEKEGVPRVGFVGGMPGSFLEAGESKAPGGYDESLFSLPRWTWIDRFRERAIADPQSRDREQPNTQRMYVIPLSAPYHPTEPDPSTNNTKWRRVVGYDSVATLSPLESHLDELDWALSQSFAIGVWVNIRGRYLWDGPKSEAIVKKWFAWAKRYRRVLSSETITLSNATSCWGSEPILPNRTCSFNATAGVDAVLHRAPLGLFPGVEERALAYVWNPQTVRWKGQLSANLYYTGLSRTAGTEYVDVSVEGGTPSRVKLGSDDDVTLNIDLPPRGMTWFVIGKVGGLTL